MPNIQAALDDWRGLLGPDRVVNDPGLLAPLEKATFATHQHIPACLRPRTSAEVAECLRIANRHGVAVAAVSQGKNWGYGSKVPVRDQNVLIELHEMNRIVDHDESLAYITVEPGVTFRRLYSFLAERGSRLMAGTGGTSPDASVVGNTLERGLAAGFNGDRIAQVCGLEVVLPTGETVHTGFGRFGEGLLSRVHRWGVGPSLDGLFSQSNFGIVTRMTLWLAPRPGHFQQVLFFAADSSELSHSVDALRDILLEGLPGHSGLFWNDYKIIAGRQQYPWAEIGDRTPLPLEYLKRTQRSLGGARWLGGLAVYSATAEEGKARRAFIRAKLRGRARHVLFLDEQMRRLAPLLSHAYRAMSGLELQPLVDVWLNRSRRLGVPDDKNVLSAYWRKRAPPPAEGADLNRDGCGVIWLSPTVPLLGREVQGAVELLESTLLRHRFEPNLSVVITTPRSGQVVAAILYDRDVEDQDKCALDCYHDAFDACVQRGLMPYRLGIQSMGSLPPSTDDSDNLFARLRAAFDPNDVLSPGRYDFRRGSVARVDPKR